jgi:hypothetical protein
VADEDDRTRDCVEEVSDGRGVAAQAPQRVGRGVDGVTLRLLRAITPDQLAVFAQAP